jgi:riboflavin kinase/FMN adenylyltransferase
LDFSKKDARTFIQDYLYGRIGAKEIFVGEGFAFGKGRGGSTEDLKRIGGELGIRVHIEAPVMIEGGVVSSSRIRGLLKEGIVAQASVLLGRPYVLEGEVAMGAQRGRDLGFATANLLPDEKIVPKRGVYAVKGEWRGKLFEGVAYIGSQPTFENKEIKIEVHLFHFKQDLYKDRIKVLFVEWIRDEMKFEGPQALVKQIHLDIQKAQEVFKVGGQGVLTVK